MATTDDNMHWSFWIVAAVGLLFNLMGCANFLSQLDPQAVAAMPAEYQTVIQDRPVWVTAAFALAVFGGAVGSILLLLKNKLAANFFLASLFGAVVAQVPLLTLADLPVGVLIGGLTQVAASAFLWWYARRQLVAS